MNYGAFSLAPATKGREYLGTLRFGEKSHIDEEPGFEAAVGCTSKAANRIAPGSQLATPTSTLAIEATAEQCQIQWTAGTCEAPKRPRQKLRSRKRPRVSGPRMTPKRARGRTPRRRASRRL